MKEFSRFFFEAIIEVFGNYNRDYLDVVKNNVNIKKIQSKTTNRTVERRFGSLKELVKACNTQKVVILEARILIRLFSSNIDIYIQLLDTMEEFGTGVEARNLYSNQTTSKKRLLKGNYQNEKQKKLKKTENNTIIKNEEKRKVLPILGLSNNYDLKKITVNVLQDYLKKEKEKETNPNIKKKIKVSGNLVTLVGNILKLTELRNPQ